LQLLQDKFLSSQRIQNMIKTTFGDQKVPEHLYKTAEDTLSDIQRLILLEDFEGLRRRVMQLYRERQSCDELLNTKDIELQELREQLDVRDEAVKQIERVNERNRSEYMHTLKETTLEKQKNET